jgi:pyridoxamine 5'-phosphate oxidase
MVDPLMLLADDRTRARLAGDPWANLCVLATIDAQRNPQARVVVLRDLEQRFAVFINSTSPKYAQLGLSRRHAVLVYLASLGVQYRLTVSLEPVPAALVRKSWLDRPRIPKVMDWLYEQFQPQSSSVPSRDDLEEHYATIDAQLAPNVEAPAGALGLYLVAEHVERLELAGDRIHARRSYRRDGAMWHTSELIP